MTELELYFMDDLQQLTGESRPTLYLYVNVGLLKPVKVSRTKIMVFDRTALDTLRRIREMKAEGIPLREIKEILQHEADE